MKEYKFHIFLIFAFCLGYFGISYFAKKQEEPSIKTGDYSFYTNRVNNELVLFTIETCGYCKTIKQHLNSKNIKYYEVKIDASETNKSFYKSLGISSVPILLSKDMMLVGFNKEAVNKLTNSI